MEETQEVISDDVTAEDMFSNNTGRNSNLSETDEIKRNVLMELTYLEEVRVAITELIKVSSDENCQPDLVLSLTMKISHANSKLVENFTRKNRKFLEGLKSSKEDSSLLEATKSVVAAEMCEYEAAFRCSQNK